MSNTTEAASFAIPPLSAVQKNKAVEDPVNVYLHRPLAYAFVKAIYKTNITPNQVTLLAVLLGLVAGILWIWGSRTAVFYGGLLLWLSAIVDGADGILARAKNLHSPFGRAIDGAADNIVAALTIFPGVYHIWTQTHQTLYVWLLIPAILSGLCHLALYDFYKESFLWFTSPNPNLAAKRDSEIEVSLSKLHTVSGNRIGKIAMRHFLLPVLRLQQKLVGLLNPKGLDRETWIPSRQRSNIYRQYNQGPMQVWALISSAPHSYLLAICAMFDQLHWYILIRLVAMNVLFVIALVWQRIATTRTLAAWQLLTQQA